MTNQVGEVDIPIKLNKRNGDSSNFIFGSETKAHETAPTQGSVGISRNLTQSSPSMSKSRTPTGTVIGMIPNFSESISSIRAPPVYRSPIWYLDDIKRFRIKFDTYNNAVYLM